MDFRKLLEENEFVYLDGGMGTTFLDLGIETGEIPELLNLTSPEVLEKIHGMFIDAGSMILYSNTFGANRLNLADSGYTVEPTLHLTWALSADLWSRAEIFRSRKPTTFSLK